MQRRNVHAAAGLTVVRAGVRAHMVALDKKRHNRSLTIANAFTKEIVKNKLALKARLAIVPDHVLDVLRRKARRIIARRGKSRRQTAERPFHFRQASMQSALVSSMRSAVSSQSRRDPAIINRYGSLQGPLRGEMLASIRASATKATRALARLDSVGDLRAAEDGAAAAGAPPCREQQANFFSQIIYEWVTPVLAIGSKRTIKLDDLPFLRKEQLSSRLLQRFNEASAKEEKRYRDNEQAEKQKQLQKQIREASTRVGDLSSSVHVTVIPDSSPKPRGGSILKKRTADATSTADDSSSPPPPPQNPQQAQLEDDYPPWQVLAWTLLRQFRYDLLRSGIPAFFSLALSFVDVILLNGIINWSADDTLPYSQGIIWAIFLVLSSLIRSVCDQKDRQEGGRLFLSMGTTLAAKVFDKSMALSSISAGTASNVMTNEPWKIAYVAWMGHTVWSLPIRVLSSIGLLYQWLGPSAFVCPIVLVFFVPLHINMLAQFDSLNDTIHDLHTKRMQILMEVLPSVVVTKVLRLEALMLNRIGAVRAKEMQAVNKMKGRLALMSCLGLAVTSLLSMLTFLVYTLVAGGELTSEKIFPSLVLFSSLTWPLLDLPDFLTAVSACKLALERMNEFFHRIEVSGKQMLTTDPETTLSEVDADLNEVDEAEDEDDSEKGKKPDRKQTQLKILSPTQSAGETSYEDPTNSSGRSSGSASTPLSPARLLAPIAVSPTKRPRNLVSSLEDQSAESEMSYPKQQQIASPSKKVNFVPKPYLPSSSTPSKSQPIVPAPSSPTKIAPIKVYMKIPRTAGGAQASSSASSASPPAITASLDDDSSNTSLPNAPSAAPPSPPPIPAPEAAAMKAAPSINAAAEGASDNASPAMSSPITSPRPRMRIAVSFAEPVQVAPSPVVDHESETEPGRADSVGLVPAQSTSPDSQALHVSQTMPHRSRPSSQLDHHDFLGLPANQPAAAHHHQQQSESQPAHHQGHTLSEFLPSSLRTASPLPSLFSATTHHTEPRSIVIRRCVFGFPAKDPDPDGEDEDEEVEEAKPLLPQALDTPPVRRASRSESIISLFQLKIEKFVAKNNQLIAVVGKIGSGKSALLQAILGEMNLMNPPPAPTGTNGLMSKYRNSFSIASAKSLPLAYVKKPAVFSQQGHISYVPQQAFLETDSVRENILFGEPLKLEWYDQVIEACCLVRDLNQLPLGDDTVLTDGGANLSGGQRQRVSIARAVYARGSVYLLDDPLSALDPKVSDLIFHNLICGTLKDTLRVLVTHQMHLLPKVDHIIVMDNGKIVAQGDFKTLQSRGCFEDLGLKVESPVEDEVSKDGIRKPTLNRLSSTVGQPIRRAPVELKNENDDDDDDDDEVVHGSVKLRTYLAYIKEAGSPMVLFTLVMLCLINQGCITMSNFWLSEWGDKLDHYTENPFDPKPDNNFYLGIYVGLGVGFALFSFLRQMLWSHASLIASLRLHSNLLVSMLRAPMRFHFQTPVGKLFNTFGRSLLSIDSEIPEQFSNLMICFFNFLGNTILMAVVTPFFIIFSVPLVYVYIRVFQFYRASCRELGRMDAVTASGIFSYYSQCLSGSGLNSIRAFHKQKRMQDVFFGFMDQNARVNFMMTCANCWLAIRIELIGSVATLTACIIGIALTHRGSMSSAEFGLLLSSAATLTADLNWFVRSATSIESSITNVERVETYTLTPPEAELIREMNRPPANWPSKGDIHVKSVFMRYRENLPFCLKNLSFDIKGGEKIGIVGRTGAGKSSITNLLERLIEVDSGEYSIDGVDCLSLGLADLRGAISIILQSPILFAGTIRSNLDPSHRYTDKELIEAMTLLELGQLYDVLPEGLDTVVTENGSNYSQGERQLFCLVRAYLVKAKILIVDEATANVDPATEAMIQRAIRVVFKHTTVLTVAHRLHGIIDSDRIMVLEKGAIVEFDTPTKLIALDGIFAQLTKQNGPQEAAMLAAEAKRAEDKKTVAQDREIVAQRRLSAQYAE